MTKQEESYFDTTVRPAAPLSTAVSGNPRLPIDIGRILILCLTLLCSAVAMCQPSAHKHQCVGNISASGFSQNQLDSFISKANFEALRLKNTRDTLTFDNGFYVILLSASELHSRGMISNPSTYIIALPVNYKKPIYHINRAGQISAAHEIVNSKYSGD